MFDSAIAAAVVLAACATGATLLPRASAATRHLIWTLGVIGAVLMPIAIWLAPASLTPATTTLRCPRSS